jgi:hypothetical protein
MASSELGDFAIVLALHVLASAVVAASAYILQPARFRQPRLHVLLLLFVFAFIAPVVGALGLLFIIRTTLQKQDNAVGRAVPVSLSLPEYDVQAKDVNRSGQGAIRSRLETNVPGAVRMQSLLTLQSIPTRVANPILEELLDDETDDVRLVAFGMLDAGEKKLTVHIQNERNNLTKNLSPEQRFTCLKHLAELHWELIYASLAQGELRKHILLQSRAYTEEAIALGLPPNAGLMFLRGRVLLAQGKVVLARESMEKAVELGQPLASALPYLAEMAFDLREFDRVRVLMTQLAGLNIATRTRAIADIWTGRDTVSKVNDRRYLPHI